MSVQVFMSAHADVASPQADEASPHARLKLVRTQIKPVRTQIKPSGTRIKQVHQPLRENNTIMMCLFFQDGQSEIVNYPYRAFK